MSSDGGGQGEVPSGADALIARAFAKTYTDPNKPIGMAIREGDGGIDILYPPERPGAPPRVKNLPVGVRPDSCARDPQSDF